MFCFLHDRPPESRAYIQSIAFDLVENDGYDDTPSETRDIVHSPRQYVDKTRVGSTRLFNGLGYFDKLCSLLTMPPVDIQTVMWLEQRREWSPTEWVKPLLKIKNLDALTITWASTWPEIQRQTLAVHEMWREMLWHSAAVGHQMEWKIRWNAGANDPGWTIEWAVQYDLSSWKIDSRIEKYVVGGDTWGTSVDPWTENHSESIYYSRWELRST